MSNLRKNIIAACIFLAFGLLSFTKDKEIPRGPDGNTVVYLNMPIFIMTQPVAPYEIMKEDRPEKVEDNPVFSGQIIATINEALAKKSKGKFPDFNGVIVEGRMKKFKYIKLTGTAAENMVCNPYAYQKSKKYEAKWVYFASNPEKSYTVVKTFDKGVLGQMGLGTANNAGDPAVVMINSFGQKAEKIAKDEGIEFDGLIVKQNKGAYTNVFGSNDFGTDIEMIKWN